MSSKKTIKSAFESMMFTWGEPLEVKAAAEVFNISKEEALECFLELQQEYEQEGRGIVIRRVNQAFQFVTRAENADYVRSLCTPVKVKRLSQSALEVLAIVAYKQPGDQGRDRGHPRHQMRPRDRGAAAQGAGDGKRPRGYDRPPDPLRHYRHLPAQLRLFLAQGAAEDRGHRQPSCRVRWLTTSRKRATSSTKTRCASRSGALGRRINEALCQMLGWSALQIKK